jgi:2-polyprenyl-6-methoxyphenol hydroxylase-like FAD-dependent oxidoreductase
MSDKPTAEAIHTGCCITGGGPAGMMLGLLLARAGVEVTVLEKHKDFLRDFRGDTVHPSTLEVMHELGLLSEFLKRPHQELREFTGIVGGVPIRIADLSHLPTHCKFIALMPQGDFLDFLGSHARRYPNFHLMMQAEVTDLLTSDGAVTGARVSTPDGAIQIGADLVVGADGRHSTVRERAALPRDELGVPIDVLWMRLSKTPDDPNTVLGRIAAGGIFVSLDRGDYWQCGFVIAKGGAEKLRSSGIDSFRDLLARIAPDFSDRVAELRSWDDIKLLTVTIDRLRQWYRPGLLCIGDSAHAMSPIGGVGINLAIQDAVAAANILAASLRRGPPTLDELRKVQSRREWPARVTQRMQMMVQNRIMTRVLQLTHEPKPPLAVRLLDRVAFLRRIPARLIGVGVRPEHVRVAEQPPAIG